MNKRFKTRAKFENGFLKPQDPVWLKSGDEVELIIIKEDILEEEAGSDLMNLAENNPSFSFLENEKEDIYSPEDLKKRYKA